MAATLKKTTTSAAVLAGAKRIPLTSTTDVTVGGLLIVGGEAMRVTAKDSASAEVVRGWQGTHDRAHASGLRVYVATTDQISQKVPNGTGAAADEVALPRIVLAGGSARTFVLAGSIWVEVTDSGFDERRPARVIRKRFTIAEVNAGATILPALVGHKYRMHDAIMISVGGAAATATTVDILGTVTTSRKLLAVAVAALTQSAVVRAGAANATVLADGASFTANDENTAITIGKTGSDVATATHIDVELTYTIEE
jgi:hypothetical protein